VQERRGAKVSVFPCHETTGGRTLGQLLPRGQVGHRDQEEGRTTYPSPIQGEQERTAEKSHHLQVRT